MKRRRRKRNPSGRGGSRLLGVGLGVASAIVVAVASSKKTAAVASWGGSLAGWFLDGGTMSKPPRSALVQGACEGAAIGGVISLMAIGRDTGIYAQGDA